MAKTSRPPPDEKDPRKVEIYLAIARRGFVPHPPNPKNARKRGYQSQVITWLESQCNLYSQALNSINAPLMVTDHAGIVTFANEEARHLFMSSHELEGHSIVRWIPESVVDHLKSLASGFVLDRKPMKVEMPYSDKSGHERVFELYMIPRVQDHALVRCVFLFREETELHRLRREIEELERENHRLTTINPRTGLLNETAFRANAETGLARAHELRSTLLVVFIDANGLKKVNDDFGHESGNILIRELAHRFRRALKRSTENIAHFHGDEFAASVYGLTEEQARELLVNLAAALDFSFELDPKTKSKLVDKTVHSTSAIGGVFVRGGDTGCVLSEVLFRADEAMYECKRAHGTHSLKLI